MPTQDPNGLLVFGEDGFVFLDILRLYLFPKVGVLSP